MRKEEFKYFNALKEKIASRLQEKYPDSPSPIENWKVKDIGNFQSDLEESIQSRVSEKWVYTHLKNTAEKLPREDMLDILCRYVGENSWADYVNNQSNVSTPKNSKWLKILVPLVAAISGVCASLLWKSEPTPRQCQICFVDAERQQIISYAPLEFYLLDTKRGKKKISLDSNSCALFKTNDEQINFMVRSPYYKTDTIKRNISDHEDQYLEEIRLKTNDYALMIHIFSTSKIEDWKKRRAQLDVMIADDAQIFQIFEVDGPIMDLYNKWDFINKLTTPTRGLKNLHIIDTEYRNGKIYAMRFKQFTNDETK